MTNFEVAEHSKQSLEYKRLFALHSIPSHSLAMIAFPIDAISTMLFQRCETIDGRAMQAPYINIDAKTTDAK